MNTYTKPEIEYIDFTTEEIATGTGTGLYDPDL